MHRRFRGPTRRATMRAREPAARTQVPRTLQLSAAGAAALQAKVGRLARQVRAAGPRGGPVRAVQAQAAQARAAQVQVQVVRPPKSMRCSATPACT
jgi:acyl transferase domain-containing protein